MKKLNFSININEPSEKVWDTMLYDKTYRIWTEAFSPGSYAVTDWIKGSKALFLTPEKEGMVSRIAERITNEYLSIEHLGVIHKGRKISKAMKQKNVPELRRIIFSEKLMEEPSL